MTALESRSTTGFLSNDVVVVSTKGSDVSSQLRRIGVRFKLFDDYKSLNKFCENQQPQLIIITQAPNSALITSQILKHPRDIALQGIPLLVIAHIKTENCVLNLLTSGIEEVVSTKAGDIELISRVKALIHRSQSSGENAVYPPYHFMKVQQQLLKGDVSITVTTIEFKLALFLFSNPNVVHSREDLLKNVWGITASVDSRRVDTHTSRLRVKLGLDGEDNKWYLASVYNRGYMLMEKQS